MRTKTCLLSILLILVVAGVAAASTPDGETPANEGICDPLIGLTPGLFGLCNAYCEAQDCDFADAVSAQCEPSNQRILANYKKKQQPGDPDMPCIADVTPCECWDPDEIDAILSTNPDNCLNNQGGITSIFQADPPLFQSAAVSITGVEPNATRQCSYFFVEGPIFILRTQPLTQEQANVCLSQIQARTDFNCFP